MKQYFSFILILLFLAGCNFNKQQNVKLHKKRKEKESPTLTEIMWKDYNEVLCLLSTKYDIDTTKTKPLLIEYLRIHDPFTYHKLTFESAQKDTTVFDYMLKPRESTNSTIKRLSIQYSVSDSILSCFLYDFKVYDKLLKLEEKTNNY